MSEKKPEQQRHEGSWTFDMSNAEAIKLTNNIKFEEGPTISTALGPYTTHFWAREIAVFLTRCISSCITMRGHRATLGLGTF